MTHTASDKIKKKNRHNDMALPDGHKTVQEDSLTVRRRALLLSALVLVLCLFSLLAICFHRRKPADGLTAYIYQDGQLIETIDLHAVTEPYVITIFAADGGSNTVEIRPDAIGVTNADCPDKLCVSSGFADSTLLPIVCLPHRLVIQLEENSRTAPDVISY